MKKELFSKQNLLKYSKNSVIGIQHLFAMMGATILVPIICNMSIAMALLGSGVGTLIFYFITKKKVPVYLGSSFAFLTAFATFLGANVVGEIGSDLWNSAMGKVAVAVFITGATYVIFSFLVKLIGYKNIKKIFPPIVVGPVIIVIGMCLAPVTFRNMYAAQAADGALKAWLPALVTVFTIIGVGCFAKGFFKVIPILCGILAGYITALLCGTVNFSSVSSASWIIFEPKAISQNFGWYKDITFDWTVIMTFVPIAIVTFMEHLGDINASSVVCGKDFFKDPGVHKTLLGDGVATMAAGLMGAPCNTTYGENTAVLAITKNYNPNLLALAAIFAIVLGIFTKFGGIIGTIPSTVIAGASMLLYGMIAANGLKTMVAAKLDFSNTKNMIIASAILVVGIGMNATVIDISYGVNAATNMTLNLGNIKFSPLAVATIVGIVLNLVLNVFTGFKKEESGLSATGSDYPEEETENK